MFNLEFSVLSWNLQQQQLLRNLYIVFNMILLSKNIFYSDLWQWGM